MKKLIISVFVLIVLFTSFEVSAFSPAPPSPIGIVIEIDGCIDEDVDDDTYYIDLLVKKADIENEMLDDGLLRRNDAIPDEAYENEYANPESEWISLSLHYMYDEDWRRERCSMNYFDYIEHINYLPFSEYKIAIYEKGEVPIISKTYFTTNIATWDDVDGFKHIYNPLDKTFSLKGYTAEYESGGTSFFDLMQFIYIGMIVLFVLGFGIIESFAYLVSKQGWRPLFISLGFNMLAILYMIWYVFRIQHYYQILGTIIGVLFIPALYAAKILILHRYHYYTYRISILFSAVFYVIYIFIFFIIFR